MQVKNWNDIRYLLAVERGRTLAGAAKLMRVDETTVSRRLNALQASVGTRLVERRTDRTLRLTASGEAIVQHIEAIEQRFESIGDVLGLSESQTAGVVRLTSVPFIVNRMLAPRIGPLLTAHPELRVELVPESRDLSLTRREADIALRLGRPAMGGHKVKARRIGGIGYGVYTAAGVPEADANKLPWISFEDAMSHLPQARWMVETVRSGDGQLSGLQVHDVETAWEAAVEGFGKTLLPHVVADRDPRLRRVGSASPDDLPEREVWMLVHEDQMSYRRVRTVSRWIEQAVFSAPRIPDS